MLAVVACVAPSVALCGLPVPLPTSPPSFPSLPLSLWTSKLTLRFAVQTVVVKLDNSRRRDGDGRDRRDSDKASPPTNRAAGGGTGAVAAGGGDAWAAPGAQVQAQAAAAFMRAAAASGFPFNPMQMAMAASMMPFGMPFAAPFAAPARPGDGVREAVTDLKQRAELRNGP